MKASEWLVSNLFKKKTETTHDNIDQKPARIEAYAVTDVGLFRENNEDNLFIDSAYSNDEHSDCAEAHYTMNLDAPRLFAVFDGMGGESAGEVASKTACEALGKYSRLIKKRKNKAQAVEIFYKAANKRIAGFMTKNRLRMGTTSVIALIDGQKLTFFNCGDSRGYIYRKKDKILSCETYDHTLAQLQLESGLIDSEEYEKSADRHKLTLYLGSNSQKKGHISDTIDINSEDCILLCSDGLYEMCDNDEIREILTSDEDDKIHIMLNKAKENGGLDNITIILIEVI